MPMMVSREANSSRSVTRELTSCSISLTLCVKENSGDTVPCRCHQLSVKMGSDFSIDFIPILSQKYLIIARKPRIEYPGAFFHIIARGDNREDIFHDDEDRENYLKRLGFYLDEGKVTLYCFCLMTNHIHLLVEMGEQPVSKVLQRLHTWYARYYNRKYERVGHLFQGRYKAMLCDKDSYLSELVRYIHLNPVRAAIAKDPREYLWSSHRAYLGVDNYPFLDTDLVLSQAREFGGFKAKWKKWGQTLLLT